MTTLIRGGTVIDSTARTAPTCCAPTARRRQDVADRREPRRTGGRDRSSMPAVST